MRIIKIKNCRECPNSTYEMGRRAFHSPFCLLLNKFAFKTKVRNDCPLEKLYEKDKEKT